MNLGAIAEDARRAGREGRPLLLLFLGLVVPPILLIGPALTGQLILLDLPILAQPGIYLPADPSRLWPVPHDPVLSDPVVQFERYSRLRCGGHPGRPHPPVELAQLRRIAVPGGKPDRPRGCRAGSR